MASKRNVIDEIIMQYIQKLSNKVLQLNNHSSIGNKIYRDTGTIQLLLAKSQ